MSTVDVEWMSRATGIPIAKILKALRIDPPNLLLAELNDPSLTLDRALEIRKNATLGSDVMKKAKEVVNRFFLEDPLLTLERAYEVYNNSDPGSDIEKRAIIRISEHFKK